MSSLDFAIIVIMVSTLLALHIGGSLVFIGYTIVALGSLVSAKGNAQLMRRAAVIIGGHQVVTGLGLGFFSPNMTMLAVCLRGLGLVAVLYVLSSAVSYRLSYAEQEV